MSFVVIVVVVVVDVGVGVVVVAVVVVESLPPPLPPPARAQPRKKVDGRVRTQIENGVKLGHRSMFVVVGDRGKEAVVNLHYILTKARVKAQPSVLWCFKKELGFST